MSGNKRYYWLKLNENFFDREEIKVIENMKNGKDYIIFYLKLLLKSIKTEGELRFRDVIPYTPEMLAAITNTDIDTVRVAIDLFTKLDLMEIWDDGTLFMSETQNMIGSETGWAKQKRIQRQKNKELLERKDNVQQIEDNVQDASTECPTDIEIELDIDKELEKEIEDKDPPVPYEEIKELYNSTCKSLSKVRSVSSTRKRHLKARWKQLDFNIDTFQEAFEKVEASDFCTGKNDRGWKADFDWLIKNDNNIIKVLEGKYDNEDGGNTVGSDAARYFRQNKDKFLA